MATAKVMMLKKQQISFEEFLKTNFQFKDVGRADVLWGTQNTSFYANKLLTDVSTFVMVRTNFSISTTNKVSLMGCMILLFW